VANLLRRFELARSLSEEALALNRELGNREAATISLHNIGRIDLRTGRLADAAEFFRQSLERARELEYRELIAYASRPAQSWRRRTTTRSAPRSSSGQPMPSSKSSA
jgi:tetratricopeptide (TPR) repeat protein